MLTKKVFLFFLLIVHFAASAQVEKAERLELPLGDSELDGYQVVSVGKKGLMVYRRLLNRGEDRIELIRVDTNLKELWRGFIAVPPTLALLHAEPTDDYLFFLFQDRLNATGDFQMAAIKIDSGKYGVVNVKNIIPFNPTEFIITKEAALIGGYFNYRPLILHYNFSSQQSKILPGFFNEPGELTQIKGNEDGSLDVIVSAKNFEKRKSLWIRNYSGDGNLIKTIILQPDEDKNLIFGRSVTTSNGEQIVSGVYGRYTEYSRGVFVARIDAFGEYKINYYNFGDLQRFFNYMKAKREARVKDRIERRRVNGKKIRFNYRILVHELIPYKDQFIMLGEAFYPHYSYPNSRNMLAYAPRGYTNPLVRGEMIFDGYQYTHAVVIGFDKDGKLLWDNSFEINDVRSYQLQQFVKIQPDEERISLLYLFDNKLRTKIIKDNEVLEGKSSDELGIGFGDDARARSNNKNKLDYWYDHVLFACGIQEVEPKGIVPRTPRRVFFINKIVHK